MNKIEPVKMTDKQDKLWSLLIGMLVLPIVIIIIRFWSRALLPKLPTSTKGPKRFWWDDWAALVAVLFNTVLCGVGLKLVKLGMGQHIQHVPPRNVEPFLKLLWIEYFVFDAGTGIAKSSALFFYARIFSVTNSHFKYSLWVTHALNVMQVVGAIMAAILNCQPIQKTWMPMDRGTCVNTQALFLGSGISSLVVDVVILVMPLGMLWGLQMKLVRKFQVTFVFLCGYLTVVVSIGRCVAIVKAGKGLQLDPTYNIATPSLWLGSEIAISVTSVSLPAVFALLQRAYRDGFGSVLRNNQPRELATGSRFSSSSSMMHSSSGGGEKSSIIIGRWSSSRDASKTALVDKVSTEHCNDVYRFSKPAPTPQVKAYRFSKPLPEIKVNTYRFSKPLPEINLGSKVMKITS